MKSTWIQYLDWKRRVDEHFDQVKQLPKRLFTRRVLRLKDAMDTQWINYIECEIRVNNIKDWDQLEEAIIHRMDEIFSKMKRMTTTMNLRQDKGECLIAFISRLQIAQDSVEWIIGNKKQRKLQIYS